MGIVNNKEVTLKNRLQVGDSITFNSNSLHVIRNGSFPLSVFDGDSALCLFNPHNEFETKQELAEFVIQLQKLFLVLGYETTLGKSIGRWPILTITSTPCSETQKQKDISK